MEQKRILLIGGNFYPEPIGIGKYNSEMIEWLALKGYQCTVITSYPYYPYWEVQPPYKKKSFWYKKEIRNLDGTNAKPIEIYRCPQYVPRSPTGAKRMLLDLSFCFSSLLVLLKLVFGKKYNHVISVVPCFQIGLIALLYKKIRAATFLYHIQDLQIDAARDLKMIKSTFVINLLFKIEKCILKNADVVSSISVGMIEKIKTKLKREVVLFPNWVDSKLFYPLSQKEKLKEKFHFNEKDKIVLYSGAIGEKQGLEIILYAAKNFQCFNHIRFVICGVGPYKEKLQQLKEKLNVSNVVFMPLQPTEKLNEFLNMADLHLVIQKSNTSDSVMPSKLTSILAVGGVAIVTALKDTSLYHIISSYNSGILIEPENTHALTNAIESALLNSNDVISNNARAYAEDFLSIDKILQNYLQQIENKQKNDLPENLVLNNHKKPLESVSEISYQNYDNAI